MIADLFTSVMNTGYAIIGFILLMTVVVFVHEFGHYYVARLCGVKVDIFSLGFGKKIFSLKDKNGCEWAISVIPMGGYVKFFGDRSEVSNADHSAIEGMSEEEKKVSFHYKNLWQKLAIVSAGPLANIILCFVVFFGLAFFYGTLQSDPLVKGTMQGTPAAEAGLLSGDIIQKVGGNPTPTVSDVKQEIVKSFGRPLSFEVLRDNKIISMTLSPKMRDDGEGNKMPYIGVIFTDEKEYFHHKRFDIIGSIQYAGENTIFIAEITGAFFKSLFTGYATPDQLSGPIKISSAAGKALQEGWIYFIHLTALISMSVGLVNLLPVPMLDGGHIAFYLFELVTRMKLSQVFQEYAFKFGFILVMSLMIFTLINDLGILVLINKLVIS